MHGNYVRVETVDAGTQKTIVPQTLEVAIPASIDMIREKPPQIVENVWPTELWNAVPGNSREIDIIDLLAVNMNVELTSKLLDPRDYDSLGSVCFIEERRHYGKTRFF